MIPQPSHGTTPQSSIVRADTVLRTAHPVRRPEPSPSVGPAAVRYPLISTMPALGALATAPGSARGHVRATLARWGLSAFEDAAELLMSEMVTNAIEASTDGHGHPVYVGGRLPVVIVRLVATGHGLVLEVWDMMPATPVVQHAATYDEHGRGMFLVETLAYQWGWKTAPDWPGKCVWAELRP